MKSLWKESEAKRCKKDLLALRVYTSRLLGRNPDLVLHGGGNTSVKVEIKDFFGKKQPVLYIKGSGWDLATIEAQGFPAVRMDVLLALAKLDKLSDSQMVDLQRGAMLDPNSPNPSVEAILHAIIPYKFVDHTHADAVVTITNSKDGEKLIKELYGKRVLYVPYVMPGFILARAIYKLTKGIKWKDLDGIVLLNHGIFTFSDSAQKSYERMIKLVSQAEDFIRKKGLKTKAKPAKKLKELSFDQLLDIAKVRREVSRIRGTATLAQLSRDDQSLSFLALPNLTSVATRGLLTPDHVIRTKRVPVILGEDPSADLANFASEYKRYFEKNKRAGLSMLDCAPRWAVWPGIGTLSFAPSLKEAAIIKDITTHTMKAIEQAESLGGWKTLGEKDVFEVEYWDLEQAKLKSSAKAAEFQGRLALVTGAASGIGKACAEALAGKGALVAALDISPKIAETFSQNNIVGMRCDVTDQSAVKDCLFEIVKKFGGLDLVVSNAGTFPPSATIEKMDQELWEKSLKINLTSHEILIKLASPFLRLGIDPAILIVASKNVPAPGPGAGAYSVAKAGLAQLGRVAAMELARDGVRVNMIHPNQVFDTAIWSKDVLESRAKSYKLSVEEYKKNNLLQTEITSRDVAELVCSMLGKPFSKTTGAQVPIDGGNDRVI